MAEHARRSRLLVVVAPCIFAAAACAGGGGPQASAPEPTVSASPTSGPAGSASPTSGPAVSASSASAAKCNTSDLKVSLGGSGVAAGTWSALVTFTNQGSFACDLTGYPTVVGVTKAGVKTTATHVADLMNGLNAAGIPHVILPPGHRAGVDVSGGDTPMNAASCPPPYRELRVTPPGGSRALTVTAYLGALAANMPSCSGLGVSAVHNLADFSFPGQ